MNRRAATVFHGKVCGRRFIQCARVCFLRQSERSPSRGSFVSTRIIRYAPPFETLFQLNTHCATSEAVLKRFNFVFFFLSGRYRIWMRMLNRSESLVKRFKWVKEAVRRLMIGNLDCFGAFKVFKVFKVAWATVDWTKRRVVLKAVATRFKRSRGTHFRDGPPAADVAFVTSDCG